jgi:hypothetical protein
MASSLAVYDPGAPLWTQRVGGNGLSVHYVYKPGVQMLTLGACTRLTTARVDTELAKTFGGFHQDFQALINAGTLSTQEDADLLHVGWLLSPAGADVKPPASHGA